MLSHSPFPYSIHVQLVLTLVLWQSNLVFIAAQTSVSSTSPSGVEIPIIPDEPKTVDPSLLMPAELGKLTKVKFDHSTIEDVFAWVGSSTGFPVVFDEDQNSTSTRNQGIYITDSLDNEPIFWLLNRLSQYGLNWHFEDDIIHVVKNDGEPLFVTTNSYNLAELLDKGFTGQQILTTMEQAVCPDGWQSAGGVSTYSQLGDVLFVKTTYHAHLELQGLLQALGNHGRRTWAYDPPQHEKIREQLNSKISVRFDNLPLYRAIEDISRRSGLDIRINSKSLEESAVNARQPVSLTINDRSVSAVLSVLLSRFELTSAIRNGAVWIVSSEAPYMVAAVLDVRDLCRDAKEAKALQEAIQSQVSSDNWVTYGGSMNICFPKPGTMVLYCADGVVSDIDNLLQLYRQVLRTSKPRDSVAETEVETHYYVMDSVLASSVESLLPTRIQPKSWKNEQQPNALGTIVRVATESSLYDHRGPIVALSKTNPEQESKLAMVKQRDVLIIENFPSVHLEIARLLHLLRNGDGEQFSQTMGGMGGMGGGMGGSAGGAMGFGGGFM